MKKQILIADKRKELSVKYKKSIEDAETTATIQRNLKDALHYIQFAEPDIIIISDSLEEKLAILGLTERESEEFIVYWLPKLEKNKYNYIVIIIINKKLLSNFC